MDGLERKIDGLDSRITTTNSELQQLHRIVVDMKGLQKAMVWLLGGMCSFITVMIGLAKALHWV